MSLETVLVAVSEEDERRTEQLTATAADIARPADATVALAHIFRQEEYEKTREQLNFEQYSEVTPSVIAERHTTTRSLASAMDEAGIDHTIHGRISNGTSVSERIVELAEEVGADLILAGGRKRSPAGKAVFGSTAQEVILNAPCPVTFVRGD